MNLGNASKESAIAALMVIEKEKPGFIRFVKQELRKNRLIRAPSGSGMGAFGDDLFTFDEIFTSQDFDIQNVPENTVLVDPSTNSSENWWDGVIDFAKEAVPAYLQYEQQQKWADIQLERAKQGQPPIDAQRYTAPPVAVQVSLPPGEYRRAVQEASAGIGFDQDTMMQLGIGAAIVGGLYFLSK